jgi:transforming growth factor-beta-induced protein
VFYLPLPRCDDCSICDCYICDCSTTAVFAPTNHAFAALPPGTVSYLTNPQNVDVLNEVLTYHVLGVGGLTAHELAALDSVATLQGGDVHLRLRWYWSWHHWCWFSRLFVNQALVTLADVPASNGVVHLINQVLIPPGFSVPDDLVDLAASEGLSTLVTAVQAAGLEDALRDRNVQFTVLAPTNEAFAALGPDVLAYLLRNTGDLATILTYHVLAVAAVPAADILTGSVTTVATLQGESVTFSVEGGDTVKVNGDVTVVTPDNFADNGVAHVIDTVLLPPSFSLPPTITGAVVADDDRLSTLEIAVVAAGLADALASPGPFTVFAPTDGAFATVDADTLDALLADPTGDLAAILKYHVVEGYWTAADIVAHAPLHLKTLQGAIMSIEVIDGAVVIDGETTVIDTDNILLNGVVHYIDQVLIPPPCPWHPYWCWYYGWP